MRIKISCSELVLRFSFPKIAIGLVGGNNETIKSPLGVDLSLLRRTMPEAAFSDVKELKS